MSVGRNTTVAVNNATGTMTAVIPGCGVDGNLLPVSISHIYNSSGELNSTYGDKWRLNYQMSVKPVTLKEYTFNSSNSEVSENTKETYQFIDGDGTAHYFVLTDENKYKDEDGLGLTLTINSDNTNETILAVYNRHTEKVVFVHHLYDFFLVHGCSHFDHIVIHNVAHKSAIRIHQ